MESIKKDLAKCYQCGKCSAGCPIASFMDYTPNRLIRFIQLERIEPVLKSKTIWLCALCKTCSVRCPKEIDLAGVMNRLRLISEEENVKPGEKNVFLFHKLFNQEIKKNGRLFELSLILKYNLFSGNPTKDILLGLLMFKKGKISLFHKKTSDG
ncbi:MAG: 4Fe-4S dicluster domain-containing protein [bacterium]